MTRPCIRPNLHPHFRHLALGLMALFSCRSGGAPDNTGTLLRLEDGLVVAFDFEPSEIVDDPGASWVRSSDGMTTKARIYGALPAPGVRGGGLHFSGDDWVDLDIQQTPQHVAFALWARANRTPQKDVILFGTMNNESRLYFGFPPEENTVGVGIGADSYYGKGVPYTLDTNWHHYFLLRTDDRVRLFVDGKPVLDRAAIGTANAGIYYLGAIDKFHLQRAALHHFSGEIDELRIWSRALTDAEIAALVQR